MQRDALDAAATPDRIARLVAAGVIDGDDVGRAYEAASATPPRAEWARLVDRTLLVLGAMLTVAGVVFFFAFNWAKIPAFGKFGLIGAGIALAVGVAQVRTMERPTGKIALVVAALLVGPLLAVYGQHYQTGADPYELFLAWALLVTPWAVAARSSLLWGIWIALADTCAALFVDQVMDGQRSSWASGAELPLIAGIHLVALVAIEVGHRPRWRTPASSRDGVEKDRTLARIVALVGMASLSFGAAWRIFQDGAGYGSLTLCGVATPLAWLSSIAFYREWRRDLAMLAVAGASIVLVVTSAIGRALLDGSGDKVGGVLLLGVALVAEVAALAYWLRAEATRARKDVGRG